MRLIKLSANQPGFKTVEFNEIGLSLIVGVRTETLDDLHKEDKSYNGVGKSLLVEIIHFCLGSKANASFSQNLPQWIFTLEIEIAQKTFLINRETTKPNEIVLNGKVYKVSQFNNAIEKLVFSIPEEGISYLTYRSLIARFIRRGNQDYNDPKITTNDTDPYTILLRNLFLLGIDTRLVERKNELRKRQVELQEFGRNFKKDPFIREYYTGNKDASLQTKYLEDQIARLSTDIANFKVAEDFYEIEKEANELNSSLRQVKNRKVIVQNNLLNIEKSLKIKSDITKDKIILIYDELLSAFKAETLKRLEDVEEFHKQLFQNRAARLGQERVKLNVELTQLNDRITELNSEVNAKLAYLSDKKALDQYVSVNAQLSDLRGKLQKLQDYQKLLTKSRDDLVHIQKDLSEETIKTTVYLADTSEDRDTHLSLFSDLAKLFYPEVPAGITLENNVGDNKIRYDFDVRIEADGSDGINAVKIFCYDFAVLLLSTNHKINFIWHDSRLFSDIDPRQRATLFKIASEYSRKAGKQYIATVNEDQLYGMKAEFTPQQFSEMFEGKNIVLTLKDDGPQSKLLGIQVDMHYQ